jgi:hypothetical protein
MYVMTYQQKLEALMLECEQKANAFIEALAVNEQYSPYVTSVRSQWESAELAYMNCRNFVRTGKVDPNDIAIY